MDSERSFYDGSLDAYQQTYLDSIDIDCNLQLQHLDRVYAARWEELNAQYEAAKVRLLESQQRDMENARAARQRQIAQVRQQFTADPYGFLSQQGIEQAPHNGGNLDEAGNSLNNDYALPDHRDAPQPFHNEQPRIATQQAEIPRYPQAHNEAPRTPVATMRVKKVKQADSTPTSVARLKTPDDHEDHEDHEAWQPWMKYSDEPIQIQQRNFITNRLGPLKRVTHAHLFRRPDDAKKLKIPQYYEIIKNPMDVETLTENFKRGRYNTVREFMKAFFLIVSNSVKFNGSDHPVTEAALSFGDYFELSMKDLPPREEGVQQDEGGGSWWLQRNQEEARAELADLQTEMPVVEKKRKRKRKQIKIEDMIDLEDE